MERGNIYQVEPRFGDWGPAYVLRGPSSEMGVLTLRSGDEMENHIHEHCDESFFIVSGTATLWIDCEQSYQLQPGDRRHHKPALATG